MSKSIPPKNVRDNRANQLNPQHQEFHKCRGKDLVQADRLAEGQREANFSVNVTAPHSSTAKKAKQ